MKQSMMIIFFEFKFSYEISTEIMWSSKSEAWWNIFLKLIRGAIQLLPTQEYLGHNVSRINFTTKNQHHHHHHHYTYQLSFF